MKDYITIGSAPYGEDCVQLDPKVNYLPAMRKECERFISALRKVLGEEPEGAKLKVKSEFHDFGQYLEVVCYYETDNEQAVAYAFKCESDAPEFWPEGI